MDFIERGEAELNGIFSLSRRMKIRFPLMLRKKLACISLRSSENTFLPVGILLR